MKFQVLSFFVCIIFLSGNCADVTTFLSVFGGFGVDMCKSVASFGDEYVAIGDTSSFGGSDFVLLKYDSSGDLEFGKVVGGDYHSSAVIPFCSGHAVIGYTTAYSGTDDLFLSKFTFEGDLTSTLVIGDGDAEDVATSIDFHIPPSDEASFIVTGYGDRKNGVNSDIYILQISVGSNEVDWFFTLGGDGDDIAYSVISTHDVDGGFILCGSTTSFGSSGKDVIIIKFNSTGGIIWGKTYGIGSGDGIGFTIKKRVTNDGYFVVGETDGVDDDLSFLALLIDLNGEIEWARRVSSVSSGGKSGIPLADGSFMVVGSCSCFHAAIVKIDENGDQVYCRRMSGVSGTDTSLSVVNSFEDDDSFIVCGVTKTNFRNVSFLEDLFIGKVRSEDGDCCDSRWQDWGGVVLADFEMLEGSPFDVTDQIVVNRLLGGGSDFSVSLETPDVEDVIGWMSERICVEEESDDDIVDSDNSFVYSVVFLLFFSLLVI